MSADSDVYFHFFIVGDNDCKEKQKQYRKILYFATSCTSNMDFKR